MRRSVGVIAVSTIVLLVAAAAAGLWVRDALRAEYRGFAAESVDVDVRSGMTARDVAASLAGAGVIRSEELFVWWLWWNGDSGRIQAGEYRFSGAHSPIRVAEMLVDGRVLLHSVTVPEGSTRWQVAEAIVAAGFGTDEEALAATEEIGLIADLDAEADSLEGYLFPETYLVPASHDARRIVRDMVAAFREVWTEARAAAAANLDLSLREVVTLASLIEAETPVAAEREVVSGVFHNRLGRGMLLQTDPTVIYAMILAGREDRTIRLSDLRRDSPYNTYLYPGLPVGPIGSPRAASIDAALEPADVDYLYFVSRNDGTHAFSRTLREHNRLVNLYQR